MSERFLDPDMVRTIPLRMFVACERKTGHLGREVGIGSGRFDNFARRAIIRLV